MAAFADNYTGGPGETIYCGHAGPVSAFPAWRVDAPLNAWKQIAGTSGAGGANLQEFSSFQIVGDELFVGAAGGHNIWDNRVTSIDLSADAPPWVLRNPSSLLADVQDAAYYADGKPNSRHTRFNFQWMPGVRGGRLMFLGARDAWGPVGAVSYPTVDGFDPVTNAWDPAGTYPSIPLGVTNGSGCVDDAGNGWANGESKFAAATETWSDPLTAFAAKPVRYPWCNATGQGYMFGLCYGDGWGASLALGVCAIRQSGTVQESITFNSSAALTQFIADIPSEAGMSYDPVNNWFLFYAGAVAGRVYKVIPNASTVWDMEIFSYGAGNDMPPVSNAGTQNRIQYHAGYQGFLLIPSNASNIYFMRTS